jgi:hypothetical protein
MSLESTDSPILKPLNMSPAIALSGHRPHRALVAVEKLSSLLTMRNLVAFTVTTAFATVLAGFIYYFSHLVFTKPLQVKKGSLPYAIFIGKFVKDMPAFKPLEKSEKFYFNLLSNASTPVNVISFESHAPPEEIISYYRAYFELVNFAFVRNKFDDHIMAIFRNTHDEFAVFVTTGESFNTVTIENTKYR